MYIRRSADWKSYRRDLVPALAQVFLVTFEIFEEKLVIHDAEITFMDFIEIRRQVPVAIECPNVWSVYKTQMGKR